VGRVFSGEFGWIQPRADRLPQNADDEIVTPDIRDLLLKSVERIERFLTVIVRGQMNMLAPAAVEQGDDPPRRVSFRLDVGG
jgi:hypothetical protein